MNYRLFQNIYKTYFILVHIVYKVIDFVYNSTRLDTCLINHGNTSYNFMKVKAKPTLICTSEIFIWKKCYHLNIRNFAQSCHWLNVQ